MFFVNRFLHTNDPQKKILCVTVRLHVLGFLIFGFLVLNEAIWSLPSWFHGSNQTVWEAHRVFHFGSTFCVCCVVGLICTTWFPITFDKLLSAIHSNFFMFRRWVRFQWTCWCINADVYFFKFVPMSAEALLQLRWSCEPSRVPNFLRFGLTRDI